MLAYDNGVGVDLPIDSAKVNPNLQFFDLNEDGLGFRGVDLPIDSARVNPEREMKSFITKSGTLSWTWLPPRPKP